MPKHTPNLDLYKVDGRTDGNDTFNVDVVLNDNWDKIDAAVKAVEDELGNITVPDASLTQKGITQLSNLIDGDREDRAATEKAVHDATKYADAQIAYTKAELQHESKQDVRGIERELANLNLQLEASKRVPSGVTFGSNFADSFGMTIDTTKTVTTAAISAGATSIPVESITGLTTGMEVTIYDDINIERVKITSISGNTLSVPALTKAYKLKANVARTSAVIDAANKCATFGGWGIRSNYEVADSVVYGSSAVTSYNGGRKLVRTSKGFLFAAFIDSADTYTIRRSTDNGATWGSFTGGIFSKISDICLTTDGEYIYCLVISGSSNSWSANVVTCHQSSGNTVSNRRIDSDQTAVINGCSITINSSCSELHAAWISRNSTYLYDYNIRYAKGVIGPNGTVTWGQPQQVTKFDNSGWDCSGVSIVVNADSQPCIIAAFSDPANYYIRCYRYKDSGGFSGYTTLHQTATYKQASPSAIFIPKSINGLDAGRIWVAWHGGDSISSVGNIRVSYSDDGGDTWSQMFKLTNSTSQPQLTPSITADNSNKVYLLWSSSSSGRYNISQSIFDGNSWGQQTYITHNNSADAVDPNALVDLSIKLDIPLFIYTDKQSQKVGFYGTWHERNDVLILENDIRFKLKNTNEAVTWVQHDAGLTLEAAFNGETMEKITDDNEDQFLKVLDAAGPAEIRLTMKRPSTSEDVKITKILGGVE